MRTRTVGATGAEEGGPSPTPFQDELRELYRLWSPDGESHVVLGVDGEPLCGALRAGAAPDLRLSGEVAWSLATCPSCKLAAERVVAGAEIERLAAEREPALPPLALADEATGEEASFWSEERDRRTFRDLWLSLFAALFLIAVGATLLGLVVGVAGAGARLAWCLRDRPSLRLERKP